MFEIKFYDGLFIAPGMVMALRVYDPDTQSNGTSICKSKGCDHLCLPTSATTATCKCAIGFTAKDEHECIGKLFHCIYKIRIIFCRSLIVLFHRVII